VVIKKSKGALIKHRSPNADVVPTIVFLGSHVFGSSREAVRAASKLGFFTVVFNRREKIDHNKFTDVDLMIRVDHFRFQILNEHIKQLKNRGKQVMAIVSFLEPYVSLATLLAKEHGINLFSLDAIKKMENKILTRDALVDTPYNPYYTVISSRRQLYKFIKSRKNMGNLVVKSPRSYSSKDVFLAKNTKQLKRYANFIFSRNPRQPILIEEYISGQQYLVEVLVHKAQVHIVAIIKPEIMFNGRFIVTGNSVLNEYQSGFFEEIYTVVSSIVHSLGMTTGACHLELKVLQNDWKLIEANPRIAGTAMNKAIEVAYGINLVKQTLRMALGEEPRLEKEFSKSVFTQYLTVSSAGILKSVTGRIRASKQPGVREVYIISKPGSRIAPPKSMTQRCGYVMAVGDSPNQARTRAKVAAAKIRLHLK